MSTDVGIGLTQLVLWYDATRMQVWPAFLAQIPADLTLPSATDFGRRFDTERMTDRRHAAAEKIVRNLPGLEQREDRLVLKGIGLLTKTEHGYTLSRDGAELRQSYLADPKGKAWLRLLARLLLLREPRTRVLVRLMSQLDATLVFDGDGWFAGSIRKAYVETVTTRRTSVSVPFLENTAGGRLESGAPTSSSPEQQTASSPALFRRNYRSTISLWHYVDLLNFFFTSAFSMFPRISAGSTRSAVLRSLEATSRRTSVGQAASTSKMWRRCSTGSLQTCALILAT